MHHAYVKDNGNVVIRLRRGGCKEIVPESVAYEGIVRAIGEGGGSIQYAKVGRSLSLHEIVERCRIMGPLKGREFFVELNDLLIRNPQLRQHVSGADLAMITAWAKMEWDGGFGEYAAHDVSGEPRDDADKWTEGGATKKEVNPADERISNQKLFERTGEGFENLQIALGIKKPIMGEKGADAVRKALGKHPGGKVIEAILSLEGPHDRNGFPERGQDAFRDAIEGKFTKKELDAAAEWLQDKYNLSRENGSLYLSRFIRGTVQTVKPKAETP